MHANMDSSSKGEASKSQWPLVSKDLPSLRRIGRGLSGFVYETTWKETTYARKDFPLENRLQNHIFEREASILIGLDHPNIVKCYGYIAGNNSCSLLQEYVDDDLQNTIQRGVEAQRKVKERENIGVSNDCNPETLREVVDIISQIATGMTYLHEHGVVHGDLKPQNVLVCWELDEMEVDEMTMDQSDEWEPLVEMESGEMIVKVADFGLVDTKRRIRLVSKRTQHFEALMWKAPEIFSKLRGFLTDDSDDPFTDSDEDERFDQLSRNKYRDPPFLECMMAMADVYSFGLTCSHILGGKLLYPELSLTQLRKQRSGSFRPELPSDCPYYIKALVYSCLESVPLNRPTFSDILRALKGLQSEEPQWTDFLKDLYSVGTPMFYLVPPTECVEKLQAMTTGLSTKSPKFNSEKCKHVVHKLTIAVKSARSYLELFPKCLGFPSPTDWAVGLKLLSALAKQVESFVEGCCKLDARSLAAIILPNMSEDISLVCSYLELYCTAVFLGNKNWGATQIITLTEAEAIIKAEGEIVEGKASLEKETLLVDVKALIQSSKSGSEGHQLATFLLHRLEGPNSSNQSRVWKAYYKDLELKKEAVAYNARGLVEKAIWLGVPVAVRIFFTLRYQDLEREMAIYAGLSHRNVISLFFPAIDDRWGAIVVELMDENLSSLMHQKKDPFSDFESVDLILQAAQGMLYLHENHIMHGNLNPASILVKRIGSDRVWVKVDIDPYHNKQLFAPLWSLRLVHSSLDYMDSELHEFDYRDPDLRKLYDLLWERRRAQPEPYEKYLSIFSEIGELPFKSDVYSFGKICEEILSCNKGRIDDRPQELKQLVAKCLGQEATTRPTFEAICAELRYLKYLLLTSTAYLTTLDGLNAPGFISWHRCCRASCPSSFIILEEEPKQKDRHCENCAVAHAMVLRERAPQMAGMEGDELNSSQKLLFVEPEDVELLEGAESSSEGAGSSVSKVKWRTCIVARKRFYDSHLFDREVDVALAVWHPRIIRCFGYSYPGSSDPEYRDLFMELLDNDLNRFITERALEGISGPFSFRSAVGVLLQVAEAVKHLHEKNFVHGNLNPSNILMSCYSSMHQDDQLYSMKVAGFSSSQCIDSSGAAVEPLRSEIDTLFYTAPEVLGCRKIEREVRDIQNSPRADLHKTEALLENLQKALQDIIPQKIDVYSFGVVAYQVLTGVTGDSLYASFPPAEENYTEGVMKPDTDERQWRPNRVWNESHSRPLEHVSLEDNRSLLIPLIERCWASSPRDRPTFPVICREIQSLHSRFFST